MKRLIYVTVQKAVSHNNKTKPYVNQ